MDYKVNDIKLKVVGYYTTDNNINLYLTSNNTVKYELITKSSNLIFYPKDKEVALNKYKEEGLNIKDSYEYSRNKYIVKRKDDFKSSLIFVIIVLIVSLIEIYLMVRSSFLSRIKEVGIYREIGMKKIDIYKMFSGEIIAITTIASLLGVALMSYSLYQLSFIETISDKFMVNTNTVLVTIVFIYIFNLLVGLLPVRKTMRKRPDQILSRTDL